MVGKKGSSYYLLSLKEFKRIETYLSPNTEGMTPELFWERRVDRKPLSTDTIDRLNSLLPGAEPRAPDPRQASTAIIKFDVSDGSHYMWDEVLAHFFEAVQEKLLFGHIFDEQTQELVFFERITALTEIETAVIRTYLPHTLLHVREYVGTGVKFFVNLDEFFIEFNHGVCKYNFENRPICPAKIRPLIFEGEFWFRYIGNAGEKFHTHSKSLVPVQNGTMTYKEAIKAIARPKEKRLRDVQTGHLLAPNVEFKDEAETPHTGHKN